MPDKSDLSHLLLRKLRELSLHERTFSMVPSDKRIEIALMPDDVVLQLDGLAERERHRRRAQAQLAR